MEKNSIMQPTFGPGGFPVEEFEAGYAARLEGPPLYTTVTLGWRAGWNDADADLRHLTLHLHLQ